MDSTIRRLARLAQQGDYTAQKRLNRLVEKLRPSRIKAADMRRVRVQQCASCKYPSVNFVCLKCRTSYLFRGEIKYKPWLSDTTSLCGCDKGGGGHPRNPQIAIDKLNDDKLPNSETL